MLCGVLTVSRTSQLYSFTSSLLCVACPPSILSTSLLPADTEAEELSNLRRLLCIPTDTYREIELATKGRIFQVRQTI